MNYYNLIDSCNGNKSALVDLSRELWLAGASHDIMSYLDDAIKQVKSL